MTKGIHMIKETTTIPFSTTIRNDKHLVLSSPASLLEKLVPVKQHLVERAHEYLMGSN